MSDVYVSPEVNTTELQEAFLRLTHGQQSDMEDALVERSEEIDRLRGEIRVLTTALMNARRTPWRKVCDAIARIFGRSA